MKRLIGVLRAAVVTQCLLAPAFPVVPGAIAGEVPGCTTEIVTIKAGPICGKVTSTASGKRAEAFLGIPFAESTARDRRWTPPVPKEPWTGTREAVQFGPSCPQTVSQPKVKPQPESEDCLSLNVWKPAGTGSAAGLPVMVFIYGGAFKEGSSSDPMYDGAYLAANRNVVLVSLNYRLGVLGFLATDGLSGNYGFMDQQLALSWVQDNIRGFGGDPGKVTIFGESAGAMAVGLHLYSAPGSAALFRAAIMQSNFLALPYKSLEDQVNVGNIFKQGLNCRDLNCLRRTDVNDLLLAQEAFTPRMSTVFSGARFYIPFTPVIDGTWLVRQPVVGAAHGAGRKPVLMGTNKDEAVLFVEGESVSPADYSARTASLFGRHFEKVIARYPARDGSNNVAVSSRVQTQYFLTCSARHVAASIETPVYGYVFNHQPSFQVWGGPECRKDGNVCHGAELPFVFNSAGGIGGRFTPEEEKLADAVMDYWTNFAAHLDPDGDPATSKTVTRWPQFGRQARRYLALDVPAVSVKNDPYHEACDFWDGIGYNLTEPWAARKSD